MCFTEQIWRIHPLLLTDQNSWIILNKYLYIIIESFAILKLRRVNYKLQNNIIFTMQDLELSKNCISFCLDSWYLQRFFWTLQSTPMEEMSKCTVMPTKFLSVIIIATFQLKRLSNAYSIAWQTAFVCPFKFAIHQTVSSVLHINIWIQTQHSKIQKVVTTRILNTTLVSQK